MAITGGMLGAAHTTSTADDFVPELWADGIYRYFERGTVFRGLVEDYSALVRDKGFGDTIHIPQIDLKAATAKVANTLVTYDATATTETSLTITDHYYNAIFEDVLMVQAEADLVAKYTKMFGEALARQLDADIWDDLDGMNVSVALGSGDDNLAVADWQAALASLGENDIPYMDGDCALVVNPTMMADILDPNAGISKYFWRADAGGNTSVLNEGGSSKGFIGKLHGINVYMSNTVSTGGSVCCGAIFHRSAAAIAVQKDVRVQADYSIDALGTKVVADLLYGTVLIDSSSNKRGYRFVNN